MDVISLALEITNQPMNGIQGSISMGVIDDIINWLPVEFQYPGMEMNGALCRLIVLASKLSVEADKGALEPRMRGSSGMQNEYFANWMAFFQKKIKREGDNLWLTPQSRDKHMWIIWHSVTPIKH